jgi:hypothetical protein
MSFAKMESDNPFAHIVPFGVEPEVVNEGSKRPLPPPPPNEADALADDAKKRKKAFTSEWSAIEEAQLRKAMIVIGNKKWKEMSKFFPLKSATQLREKYKALGGAWGQLKPILHEFRYLEKEKKLHEREVLLTEEEVRVLDEGGDILFKLEKPAHSSSSRRSAKEGDEEEEEEEDEDDDDDDQDDDEEEAVTVAPKITVRRRNKPVSAVLLKLTEEQIDVFKKKRVAEIFEQNIVRKEFEHKSMAHLSRLRHLIPVPPPPPEPVFGNFVPVEDVTAKVSGLVSSRLFGPASVDGRSCASLSLDMPAQATLESSRVFLRVPVFLKAAPGSDDSVLVSHTPEEWRALAKNETSSGGAVVPKKSVPVKIAPKQAPAPSAGPSAPPKGIMKAGLARPKVVPAASAAPPPAKKKKTNEANGSARLRVEMLPVPLMDQYMRRHFLSDSSLLWSEFRRSVALEQHINAIVKRSGGDSAMDVTRISLASGCEDRCQLLDAAALGNSVVRSLRLGEPEKSATGALQSAVYVVTHWLPNQQMDVTFKEPVVRTNLVRVTKGDSYVGALHSSGLIAAVAVGATITVFDLGPAGTQPGQAASAKPVSIHQESNFPITHLSFSHHTPKTSFLCSFDGQALRVWRAWTNEQSRKFITPLSQGDISAPYVVSTTLLQSFRDPLPDPSAPYDIVWHARGDLFVTYSSAVARVWRFKDNASEPVRNPTFEHRVLEGIVSVSFLPDLATEVLVVLTSQQKLRFIDLTKPNEFAKTCATVQGLPWCGFVFHHHHPRLLYGVTLSDNPMASSAVTALHVTSLTGDDDDSQLNVSKAYFGVPEETRNESALARPDVLSSRARAILCLDAEASLMVWFDAAKSTFVCTKFLPSIFE